MTRLEKQIEEKTNELNELINFSNEKLAIFEAAKPKFIFILKAYRILEFNADNCFVDKGVVSGELILRMYLKIDGSHLSKLQLKNLEKRLSGIVPMPIGAVNTKKIELCYYD